MLRPCFMVLLGNAMLLSNALSAQTADLYKKKSDGFYYGGKYDSALYYAKQAGALISRDSGETSSAFAYFAGQYYGYIYHKLGDIPTELYWYRKAVGIFETLHDTASTDYAETVSNYGELITSFGSFSEAEPYLLQAEKILRPYTSQLDAYGGAANNLANVYSYTGRYSQAEEIFTNLLTLVKKVLGTDQNIQSARLYNNLGIVYNKTGRWNKSEAKFKSAIELLKKLKADKTEYYTAVFNLGQVYAVLHRNDEAITIFREVTDSAKNYVLAYGAALNGIAQVLQQQHKMKEAEEYYLAALRVLGHDEQGARIYAGVESKLATLYAADKSPKTDSLLRLLLDRLTRAKDRDQYIYLGTFSQFCTNLLRAGKTAEAGDSLQSLSQHLFETIYGNFEGMPQDEKLLFVETLKEHFDLVYSLLASGKGDRQMIRLGLYNLLQLKGMILTDQSDLYSKVRNSKDTALITAFHNWQNTRQVLYNQYALSPRKRIFKTDSLEALAESYERQFSVKGVIDRVGDKDELIDKIRNSISANEAVIEYVRFNLVSAGASEPVYGAFIMKQGMADPVFVKLCTEKQLKQLLKMEKGKEPDADELMNRIYRKGNLSLYSLLWKPLEKHLANIRSVYYSPAGVLNLIALNPVSLPNNKLLMDRYNLYLLSSAKDLPEIKHEVAAKPAVASLWGNMDYSENVYLGSQPVTGKTTAEIKKTTVNAKNTKGGGFSTNWQDLAYDEIGEIKALFKAKKLPVNMYRNQYATEDSFKKVVENCQGILHLSTHGFFSYRGSRQPASSGENIFTAHINPLLRCGLVFSGANYISSGHEPQPGKDDAILTGYEIAQMDLSKVDMVVLSACESGLGDIGEGDEGVMGLQRAFRLAGVKKQVVSLWSVPEVQTAYLMKLFYSNLLNGASPAAALLNAQKTARRTPTAPLPYYWAGFVLVQ